MKVLVLNCGSSSIKYKLFDMTSGEVMAQGGIEKIGLPGAFLKLTDKDGKKVVLEKEMPGHKEGIEFILSILTDKTYGCIKEYNEIDAVGHRVVHGGEKFASSVKIDRDVINKVIECSDLAPLHNPANLKGIDAMEALIPGIPQVAVFDTAFHRQCRLRLICTVCLTRCIRNTVCAVTVSMEQATAMFPVALAKSWAFLMKNRRSLRLM